MAEVYYEYVFDIEFICEPKKVSFKPHSFMRLIKTSNYIDDHISLYKLNCRIYEKDLKYLRIMDKELRVIIRQYMFYGSNKEHLTERELVSENVYAPFYDKTQIPSYMKDAKTTTSDMDNPKETYSPDTMGKITPVEVSMNLLLESDIKMRTFIHNYITGSEKQPVDPMTAAVLCIEQNPYIEGYIIDKPDNMSTYEDLIIKDNELKNAIKSIQYNYGIYSKGLTLFFDNGILYMLNKFESSHSLTKDQVKMISVRIIEKQGSAGLEYVLENKKEKSIGYDRYTPVAKVDMESAQSLLNGDKFVYSNFGSVINSMFADNGKTTFKNPLNEVERPNQTRNNIGVKKIVDYDMLNNPFNMSSYMYDTSINNLINITLTSMNCKHFTPNMNILLNFDNPESRKQFFGIYNIASAEFIYENINKAGSKYRAYGHVNLTLFNKTQGFDKNYEVK